MAYPLVQILDSTGAVAYDCNDGTTTSIPPDGFDLGSAEIDRTMFLPTSDGGTIAREYLRLSGCL